MARVVVGPFSLDVFAGWSLNTVILAGPVDDSVPQPGMHVGRQRGFQRNVVVTMEQVAEEETLDAYLRRQREALRKGGALTWEQVDPEHVEVADGLDGLLTERVIEASSGELVRQMQLTCIKQRTAYVLIASHFEGSPFEAARSEFRSMLLSLV